MSILQEYEEIRKHIGIEKYDMIEKYIETICPKENVSEYEKNLNAIANLSYYQWLDIKKELEQKYGIVYFSDVIFKPLEWEKYNKWYYENVKHQKIDILNVWKTDDGDIECEAILYKNNKIVAKIIDSYDIHGTNDKEFDEVELKNKLQVLLNDNFEKYLKLPKLSKCSELLKYVYDQVCTSECSMCHIAPEDWNDYMVEDYTEKEIEKLKKEVEKYNLSTVLEIENGEYKILGYGNLQYVFNDDREIAKEREYER